MAQPVAAPKLRRAAGPEVTPLGSMPPRPPKRLDPSTRNAEAITAGLEVMNKKPGWHYVGIFKGDKNFMAAKRREGYRPVVWQLDKDKQPVNEYFGCGVTGGEGEVVTGYDFELWACDPERHAENYWYGWDGESGQESADEIEQLLKTPSAGRLAKGEDYGPGIHLQAEPDHGGGL